MALPSKTVDIDFPNTTESYKLYSQRVIASDIKECVCRAPDTPYDESAYSNIPMTPYELPDGQTIEIGADRFKIPDVLFNPPLAQTIPGMNNFAEISPSFRGLPQMVIESINRCDVDIRKELFGSILLAGGTASMQQLKERLEKDLLEESPQAARVKVLASGNATERRFRKPEMYDAGWLLPLLETQDLYLKIDHMYSCVWIGGSILASLGSFQQMWFSKSDFSCVLVIATCIKTCTGMKSMELHIYKENALKMTLIGCISCHGMRPVLAPKLARLCLTVVRWMLLVGL
ncbi:hypothetical protein QUC31_019387 [Theobroma cacao]